MKIEDITRDNKLIHVHSFDNLVEVVDFIKNTDPFTDIWEMSSLKCRPDFTGVQSLDEALDLCLKGYKTNFKEFMTAANSLNELLPQISKKRRVRASVYGFRPNINKFMTGNPNSMYKLVRKEEKKFVNIYFNVSYSCVTSKEAVFNKGIITISLIKFLEQLGTQIDFNLFELSFEDDEFIYNNVSLKKPWQNLDTSIANFPMCHPAFLRCICFAINERTKVKYPYAWGDSYGVPCKPDVIRKTLQLDEHSIVLSAPDTLGVWGDDIVEDTINFIEHSNFNMLLEDNQRLEFDEFQKKFILTR